MLHFLQTNLFLEKASDLDLTTLGDIYEKDSSSHAVIQTIVDTYYLVCLVDNDYVEKECALWTFLDKVGGEGVWTP